jgi:uncharacterized protein
MDDRLKDFENETYLNLETLRDSGEGVPTPVWFALDGSKFYIRTLEKSYKVKRLRGNSAVRIASCEANGDLKGEWAPARAVIGGARDFGRAEQLFNSKYGFRNRLFGLFGRLMGRKWATITVELI